MYETSRFCSLFTKLFFQDLKVTRKVAQGDTTLARKALADTLGKEAGHGLPCLRGWWVGFLCSFGLRSGEEEARYDLFGKTC